MQLPSGLQRKWNLVRDALCHLSETCLWSRLERQCHWICINRDSVSESASLYLMTTATGLGQWAKSSETRALHLVFCVTRSPFCPTIVRLSIKTSRHAYVPTLGHAIELPLFRSNFSNLILHSKKINKLKDGQVGILRVLYQSCH